MKEEAKPWWEVKKTLDDGTRLYVYPNFYGWRFSTSPPGDEPCFDDTW